MIPIHLPFGAGGDELDFRSPADGQGNRDSLFVNNRDGTFSDITGPAFGDVVNLRSAVSMTCGDVDGDGWSDIYVGNLLDTDFRISGEPAHGGHYNVLFRNNGDLTFSDVSESAGVQGPEILMWDPDGRPITFEDPETGRKYEGYDLAVRDRLGNQVG